MVPSRLVFFCGLAFLPILGYSQAAPYSPPRTEHGQPDFEGVWMTNFVTLMERPDGIGELILSAQAADQLATGIQSSFTEGVTDIDFILTGKLELARVRGEYRSSIVTYPEDGRIPWNEHGLARAREEGRLAEAGFDGPEQRPLEERCLTGMGSPPLRTLPIVLPRLIVQTRDHLVVYTEDSYGMRLIHLDGDGPRETDRRFEGYSTAAWDGDSLVVTTTHFRQDFPARLNIPLPLLLGRDAVIEERFTRLSDDELNYQFTINDSEYYREPWSGEFSLRWLGGKIYEYACHEGNYSLPGALRGGIVQTLGATR